MKNVGLSRDFPKIYHRMGGTYHRISVVARYGENRAETRRIVEIGGDLISMWRKLLFYKISNITQVVPRIGPPSVMLTVNKQTAINKDVTICNSQSQHTSKCYKIVN